MLNSSAREVLRPFPPSVGANAVLNLGRLCNRNFCVGGDGVIFALKAPEGGDYDFTMRIYNSDGSGKLN